MSCSSSRYSVSTSVSPISIVYFLISTYLTLPSWLTNSFSRPYLLYPRVCKCPTRVLITFCNLKFRGQYLYPLEHLFMDTTVWPYTSILSCIVTATFVHTLHGMASYNNIEISSLHNYSMTAHSYAPF